jgi:hypothetical protein
LSQRLPGNERLEQRPASGHPQDRDDHRRRADGAPDGGRRGFFNYPPVRATVDATLAKALRCRREGIRFNTFALEITALRLRSAGQPQTRLNRRRGPRDPR